MDRIRVYIADFISLEVVVKEVISETEHFLRVIDPGKTGAGRSIKKSSYKYCVCSTHDSATAELVNRIDQRIVALEKEAAKWKGIRNRIFPSAPW